MGIEFIETTKRSVKKGWDLSKRKLSEDDLFTIRPQNLRTIQFKPTEEAPQNPTGLYILREEDNKLAVYFETFQVGSCESPPKSLMREINEHHGVCIGRLRRESSISGLIELEVVVEAISDHKNENED